MIQKNLQRGCVGTTESRYHPTYWTNPITLKVKLHRNVCKTYNLTKVQIKCSEAASTTCIAFTNRMLSKCVIYSSSSWHIYHYLYSYHILTQTYLKNKVFFRIQSLQRRDDRDHHVDQNLQVLHKLYCSLSHNHRLLPLMPVQLKRNNAL